MSRIRDCKNQVIKDLEDVLIWIGIAIVAIILLVVLFGVLKRRAALQQQKRAERGLVKAAESTAELETKVAVLEKKLGVTV